MHRKNIGGEDGIPAIVGPRWIEIDLDAVAENVTRIKKLIDPKTKLMAVVKADAYGCGLVGVSHAALGAGAYMLGVTTINEGMELREGGIEAPILLFAPLDSREIDLAVEYGLTITADSPSLLNILEDRGYSGPLKMHLKLDTGMNRLGFKDGEVLPFVEKINGFPGMELEGIYSHFATNPSVGRSFMEKQFKAFMGTVSHLEKRGYTIPIRHICNSSATLDLPHMHLDMVRIGTLIYGQYPFGSEGKIKLRDPWRVRARVIHIKEVPAGESIGYGGDFKAKTTTRMGLIPVGFSDGFGVGPEMKPKNLLDLLKMLVKKILAFFGIRAGAPLIRAGEKTVKILGRIGMQFTALDLTHMGEVEVGDTVFVALRRTNANGKLPRVFYRNKKIIKIRTPSGHMLREGEYFKESEG